MALDQTTSAYHSHPNTWHIQDKHLKKKNQSQGAEEIAQKLGAYKALTEDLCSVPSTQSLTPAPRTVMPFSVVCRYLYICVHIPPDIST